MAFKMKGSPAKMGTIKGTAAHKSMLNQRRSVLRQEEQEETPSKQDEKRDIIESFMDFLGTKQTKEGKEIGELRRKARHSQSFRERMEAKKKLRELRDKEETVSEEDVPIEGEIEGEGDGDEEREATVEGSSRPAGYYDKTSENYMKGVESRPLKEMPFFSPERIAYYNAKGWALDKTTDPNFQKVKEEKEVKKVVKKTITPTQRLKETESSQKKKKKVSTGLRFPELGKYDYRNAADYRGTDPSYPLP